MSSIVLTANQQQYPYSRLFPNSSMELQLLLEAMPFTKTFIPILSYRIYTERICLRCVSREIISKITLCLLSVKLRLKY